MFFIQKRELVIMNLIEGLFQKSCETMGSSDTSVVLFELTMNNNSSVLKKPSKLNIPLQHRVLVRSENQILNPN